MLARPSPPPERVEAWHTSAPYHEDRLAKPSYDRACAPPCTQVISAPQGKTGLSYCLARPRDAGTKRRAPFAPRQRVLAIDAR